MPVRAVSAEEMLGGKNVILPASAFPGLSKKPSKQSEIKSKPSEGDSKAADNSTQSRPRSRPSLEPDENG